MRRMCRMDWIKKENKYPENPVDPVKLTISY